MENKNTSGKGREGTVASQSPETKPTPELTAAPALVAFIDPKCPECSAPYGMRNGPNGIVESSCTCGCLEREFLYERYMKATGKSKATDLLGMRLKTPFGEAVCGSLHPFGISVSDSGYFPFLAFSWTFTKDWEWDTAHSSCAHSDWCARWIAESKHKRYYNATLACSCGASAFTAGIADASSTQVERGFPSQ